MVSAVILNMVKGLQPILPPQQQWLRHHRPHLQLRPLLHQQLQQQHPHPNQINVMDRHMLHIIITLTITQKLSLIVLIFTSQRYINKKLKEYVPGYVYRMES